MIEGSSSRFVTFSIPGDIIRALAILLVIILHAANTFEALPFSNAIPYCGVPLFVMLSGSLLLNSSKVAEPLSIFFRKRFNRIALPFFFWGMTYLAWRRFYFNETLTFDTIWRSFLGAGQGADPYPYPHFWFIYMLIGLYLLTPILRVVVAYARSKTLGYFVLIWFIGTAVIPPLEGFSSVVLDSQLFIVPLYVGYFVLGAYMQTMRLNSKVLYTILFLGFSWIFAYGLFVAVALGGIDPLINTNIILASLLLFSLLCTLPIRFISLKARLPTAYGFLARVGQYSFAIYFLHAMVLTVFANQVLFVFSPSILTLNPVLGISFLTLITLIISFGVIWLMRKVPMLNKASG